MHESVVCLCSQLALWMKGSSRCTGTTFFYYFVHICLVCAGKGLTQLDVSQNQLQNAPSNAIKNLHHLLILNLNHNRISQIHNRAFEGLDTLEILTLYENKINVIEPEAFRGLEKWVERACDGRKSISISSLCLVRKLKRLNLGGNELTSVPQRALSIFDNLKKLEIQENKIRSIKEGDFEGKASIDGHSLRLKLCGGIYDFIAFIRLLFKFLLSPSSPRFPFPVAQVWKTWIHWFWRTINSARCRPTFSVICHSWIH